MPIRPSVLRTRRCRVPVLRHRGLIAPCGHLLRCTRFRLRPPLNLARLIRVPSSWYPWPPFRSAVLSARGCLLLRRVLHLLFLPTWLHALVVGPTVVPIPLIARVVLQRSALAVHRAHLPCAFPSLRRLLLPPRPHFGQLRRPLPSLGVLCLRTSRPLCRVCPFSRLLACRRTFGLNLSHRPLCTSLRWPFLLLEPVRHVLRLAVSSLRCWCCPRDGWPSCARCLRRRHSFLIAKLLPTPKLT